MSISVLKKVFEVLNIDILRAAKYHTVMVISGEQLRAALAALGWSRQVLAEKTGLNPRTIQRMAESKGVPSANAKNMAMVMAACEKGDEHGRIEFINSDAPGIRFHRRDA